MRTALEFTMKKLAITAALFAAAIGIFWLATYEAPSLVSSPAVTVESVMVSQDMSRGAPKDFDGHVLYERAVKAFMQFHRKLADPIDRAKWAAEWQHKFDNTGDLKTIQGTYRAIRIMRDSLGERFDYVMPPNIPQPGQVVMVPKPAGIGVPVELQDVEGILKGLPKGTTVKEARSKMIIGPGHYLLVHEPMEDSPAATILKEGDLITKADDQPLDGLSINEAVQKIRGEPGTKVKITIERNDAQGKSQEMSFTIVRAKVQAHSVHSKYLGDGITSIKLDNFGEEALGDADPVVDDMSNAISKARATAEANQQKTGKNGGIIIDLRNNPGGRVDFARWIGGMLIEKGTFVVTVDRMPGTDVTVQIEEIFQDGFGLRAMRTGPHSDPRISEMERGPVLLPNDFPVVVLVNEWSASASEMLSGSLQANHRALIVGQPTLGKGVGQAPVFLPYGFELHVTSMEFLPGGKKSDNIGIIPDIEVKQADDHGKTDNQLDAAVKEIKSEIDSAARVAKEKTDVLSQHQIMFDKMLKKQNEDDQKPLANDDNETIDESGK